MTRVVVIGTSCVGKTTFAKSLARVLSFPHIELDALYWQPNWVPRPPEEFRALTAQALSQGYWVTDGNYSVAAPTSCLVGFGNVTPGISCRESL